MPAFSCPQEPGKGSFCSDNAGGIADCETTALRFAMIGTPAFQFGIPRDEFLKLNSGVPDRLTMAVGLRPFRLGSLFGGRCNGEHRPLLLRPAAFRRLNRLIERPSGHVTIEGVLIRPVDADLDVAVMSNDLAEK
jgi:hypothetical protein